MRYRKSAALAVRAATIGAVVALAAASAPARAAGCDENDPAGPVRSAVITLSAVDSLDETPDELRSFIATGSLGPVGVTVLSATPGTHIRSVTATAHVSRYSRLYGETLKGIDVHAMLGHAGPGVRVVVQLRQVCARYFRPSFLYE